MKFEYKFEHHWGGEDNWYTKSKRWAKKQPFPLSHLITGLIEWLHKLWIDGKILQVMADVDKDIDKIKSTWEENDRESTPHIVETGVFGDEGWSIEITNPIVERRDRQQLAQAWLLQAMHNDYKKMKGIKEPP